MAKFNQKTSIKTTNNEGAIAYSMKDKEKLVTQVLTSMFGENKFYGDNTSDLIETARKVMLMDGRFVANLAVYARREMHLRSVSHALAGELTQHCKKYARQTIRNIVDRPDDMIEILSYVLTNYGKPVPNSLKKGLADSFLKFDEYSLAKYNRPGDIKLKDILRIAHPKPTSYEQSDLWKRLLEGTLETPITWETQVSAKGNKAETWDELIEGNKLGYMAALRNLRNIINSGAKNIDKVYDMLQDPEKVRKSKQLPFRFYSAYQTLAKEGVGSSKVYNVLEKALKLSTQNIEKIPGITLIAADVSQSMTWDPIASKSDIRPVDIAVLMLSMANYICEDAITVAFDGSLYKIALASDNGIIANAKSIRVNGGGTNITLPIRYLTDQKIKVDRIIMFSDNEINDRYNTTCQSYLQRYATLVNPDVWLHAIDLQGYGTQQFYGPKVNIITGWNEKIFEFIHMVEHGLGGMVSKIENYLFE